MSKPGPNYGWGRTDPLRLMRWAVGVVAMLAVVLVLLVVAAVV